MRVHRYDIIGNYTVTCELRDQSLMHIARFAELTIEETARRLRDGLSVVTPYSVYHKGESHGPSHQ